MMNLPRWAVRLAAACLALAIAAPAAGATTKCTMKFTLKEWSVFYKRADGQGTITCDNGQTAPVRITARGGGLTAGKGEIRDGKGTFSEVSEMSELFGTYVSAEASAGAVKNAAASVVTKGEITLGLEGKGTGWELGVSFGKFIITRK
ncbi:MAG TPA: hypothetical protein VHB47_21650 [Thermoanaerobaculia bacterium]|jgi:hypothetical protein|nr:hypothetical protein [Thermoanaerobaculia bacterium]HXO28313.1 hypothetical protein [Thermoanaerobaculia bacterium]